MLKDTFVQLLSILDNSANYKDNLEYNKIQSKAMKMR